jgi:SAM-dependent methyltransferase
VSTGCPITEQETPRLTTHEILCGYQVAHATFALHMLGVLASMTTPKTASELAGKHGLQEDILRPLLDLLAFKTTLVAKGQAGYWVTPDYTPETRFNLEQYMGAYGRNTVELASVLRDPSRGPELVDAAAHAGAYANFGRAGLGLAVNIVAQLGFRSVLDIGCGPGLTLIELARRNPNFTGYGLDMNPHMLALGRQRVQTAGLSDRIKLVEGDAAAVESLSAEGVDTIDCVLMGSVLNGYFDRGAAGVVSVLSGVRQRFPESAFIVADYYGALGRHEPPWVLRTIIHDFVQIASAQGVPPENSGGWASIYAAAGCLLIHVVETHDGTGFVHIGKLGGTGPATSP